MSLFDTALDGPTQPSPDAVLVPGWLTLDQQAWIVGQFNQWARGPVPIRAAKVGAHEMSVRTAAVAFVAAEQLEQAHASRRE